MQGRLTSLFVSCPCEALFRRFVTLCPIHIAALTCWQDINMFWLNRMNWSDHSPPPTHKPVVATNHFLFSSMFPFILSSVF